MAQVSMQLLCKAQTCWERAKCQLRWNQLYLSAEVLFKVSAPRQVLKVSNAPQAPLWIGLTPCKWQSPALEPSPSLWSGCPSVTEQRWGNCHILQLHPLPLFGRVWVLPLWNQLFYTWFPPCDPCAVPRGRDTLVGHICTTPAPSLPCLCSHGGNTNSSNCLGSEGPWGHPVPHALPWAGTAPTRAGCWEPCQGWARLWLRAELKRDINKLGYFLFYGFIS